MNNESMGVVRSPFLINSLLNFATTGELPERIQILPLKDFDHPEAGHQVVTDQMLAMMKANFDRANNFLVMDYEHASIFGDTAPAAGWIKDLQIMDGEEGLWASVDWTPRAGDQIKAREYKYGSPVYNLKFDTHGNLVDAKLHSHAITNTPVIDGMTPLFNKNHFSSNGNFFMEGNEMPDLTRQLASVYGLKGDVKADEILALVNKDRKIAEESCKTDGENTEIADHILKLELENEKLVNSQKAILESLGVEKKEKNEVLTTDRMEKILSEKYVNKADFDTLKEALNVEKHTAFVKERDEIITCALSAGKISPAQKESMEKYSQTDFEGFKSFINSIPNGGAIPVGEKIVNTAGKKILNLDVANASRVDLACSVDSYFSEHPELDRKDAKVYRDVVKQMANQNPELLNS